MVREVVNEKSWSGSSIMDTSYFLMIPLVLSAAGGDQVRWRDVGESTVATTEPGAAVGAVGVIVGELQQESGMCTSMHTSLFSSEGYDGRVRPHVHSDRPHRAVVQVVWV